ncbi:MAG: phosphopyruvate hydratase [Candidatus Woesearchaeota archaeon]|nr:phosphopyruvate hydratase [Candidatus Woesearchaeota archaeon]
MYKITKVKAREILDSRGNPTVEVDVYTKKFFAREQVPSGASTGSHEAVELRDGTKRFMGKGVQMAVNNVHKYIAKKIVGMDVRDQKGIDNAMIELDSTPNKARLGANAILGVSLACARCSSVAESRPLYSVLGGKNVLPIPFMNVINGGKHADNSLSFQEFMIVPRAKTFAESLRLGAETYQMLKKVIKKKYGNNSTNVGDEGGFAPNLSSEIEAIHLLLDTIESLGYQKEISLAIDAASSEFFRDGQYNIGGKDISPERLMGIYESMIKDYPIVSLEDPFAEDDFNSWEQFTKRTEIQVVGDDLLATNPLRIKMGIDRKLCNALLLKVNQIGTLTEAVQAAKMAMDNGWHVMVSHRSGETASSFIADLAVGLGCGQIKSGAPCRSERLEKYNQLLRIEEELGSKARYVR